MSDTPRSSRSKKKSTLSKLADRKGRNHYNISDDSDVNSSRNSLQDRRRYNEGDDDDDDDEVHTSHRSRYGTGSSYSKSYPIDAKVQVHNDRDSDEEADSDEGVGMGGNRGNRSARLPSDGTLNRLRSLNMDSSLSRYDAAGAGGGNSRLLDHKGEKRFRDQNSDGDEMVKDTSRARFRKQLVANPDSDEKDSDELAAMSRTKRTPEALRRSLRSSSSSPSRKMNVDYDIPDYKPQSGGYGASAASASGKGGGGYMNRTSDSDDLKKYQAMLELSERYQDSDEEMVARRERADNVPDLKHKYSPPRHSALSPTPPQRRGADLHNSDSMDYTNNTLRSLGRPWTASERAGNYDEMMSQRSYASSSVLPMISTKEARNRSFLEGSINTTSLLGSEELERLFPDRKMRIFVGTWNMCEMKLVPESLDDFVLPDTSDFIHDMYVIGTQESVSNRREWGVKLQETLGPQHVLFHSGALGVLYLNIFIRRDLIWFCSVSEEDSVSTRAGPSGIKTKGGVGVCFTFFGTSFLFVNSHLSPHDGKIKDRIADYNKICSTLKLPKVVINPTYANVKDDVTGRFDCVFWLGDLNFRLEKERDRVHHKVKGIESSENQKFDDLLQYDELFRARNECNAFQDFQEGRIKFKPTYKYNVGSNEFDSSPKLRIPSYTDRILFRCKKKHSVSCLFYDSAQSVMSSDHKPVYGMYEVTIRPGRDTIPLSAGQFSRDIWLEANKRRSERFGVKSQKSSSVCSIQ